MGNEDEEGLASLDGAQLAETYDLYIEKDEDYRKRYLFGSEWETTPMMMRLLHLPAFLAQIGAEEEQSLTVAVTDPIVAGNQGTFRWEFTKDGSRLVPVEEKPECTVSIGELASFLSGMTGPGELLEGQEQENRSLVREKLGRIRVLEGIYINETV